MAVSTRTNSRPISSPARNGRMVSSRPKSARLFPISTAQYLKMGELGFFGEQRVELIDGKVFQMAPMNESHWDAVADVPELLKEALPKTLRVLAQLPLALEDGSEPEPDIVVCRRPQSGRIRKSNALEHIVLVIELSDATLNRDRTTKAALYAGANIPEYWIVNLKAREIEVLREPKNGKYSRKSVVKETDVIAPLAAPDAKIEAKDLLP